MTKKLSFTPSRSGGEWLVRVLLLALAGALAGLLLGEMIAEPLAAPRALLTTSYSRHSANPEARVPQGETAAACISCPDSYGVAARLRAERAGRMMDGAFRELGAVDIDAPLPAEPADDSYRYGGRFPDPSPKVGTVPAEDAKMIPPAVDGDVPPEAGFDWPPAE